jgi:hypothetical protein
MERLKSGANIPIVNSTSPARRDFRPTAFRPSDPLAKKRPHGFHNRTGASRAITRGSS